MKHDAAEYFRESFQKRVLDRVVTSLNLANDPVVERIVTEVCVTAAEYLAYEKHACSGHYDRYDILRRSPA